jgi:hypothetical protein
VGSEAPLLDAPTVGSCGRVVSGRFGGHTGAGAEKNEDGALVWCAEDGRWELAVLLDAHFSAESAALVLTAIEAERAPLTALFDSPPGVAFPALHARLLALFTAPGFRARCRAVTGEASCLICLRMSHYVWWMCIGDCVLYCFHPKLAAFGQVSLTQRSFYEWVGHVNTFEEPAPCYTTGTRLLLPGTSTIVLLTDGVLECGSQPFADAMALYRLFHADPAHGPDLTEATRAALRRVERERGRDSATILTWRYERW